MADCSAVAPRDPRLRPYRAALWILYFAIIVIVGTLVIVSIARNLRGTPTRHPARTGALPTRAALRVCMTDLEALYREQNQRAWSLGSNLEAPDPLAAWAVWARAWEGRVDDLTDRCHLDVTTPGETGLEERTELAAARDAILALHRAYAVQVDRFAQEQADLARAAAEALAHARRAVEGEP